MTMHQELEVCRSLFDSLAYQLDHNAGIGDYYPLSVLASEGKRQVDAIISTVTDDCILKRADWLELTDVPTAATERVYTLMTELKATLDMGQVSRLMEIERLSALEIQQSQDGLARRLCSCDDCRSLTA